MRWLRAAVCGASLIIAGCQTVAPAVMSLIMAFGQDLLAATAVNYSPRYAVEVENLLAVLARHATGLEFQGQLAQAGYQPPPPSYARQEETYDPYSGSSGYQDPYAGQTPAYGQATYQDPYAASQVEPVAGYQDPYAVPAGGYQTRSAGSAAPVSLGVALLAQRAGTNQLEAIDDGDTLVDGRGDPSRGDLLRIHFQANCTCWVYVVGIDATGYVARIFPDPDSALRNPVTAGANYLMPGGSQWWALDDHRGVEQIYFVASRERRPDIEAAIEQLAGQPRQINTESYQPVSEPAIVPVTRGLVKVDAPAPVGVPMGEGAPAMVTPTIFTNAESATDVVVTRWFHHE